MKKRILKWTFVFILVFVVPVATFLAGLSFGAKDQLADSLIYQAVMSVKICKAIRTENSIDLKSIALRRSHPNLAIELEIRENQLWHGLVASKEIEDGLHLRTYLKPSAKQHRYTVIKYFHEVAPSYVDAMKQKIATWKKAPKQAPPKVDISGKSMQEVADNTDALIANMGFTIEQQVMAQNIKALEIYEAELDTVLEALK